MQDSGPTKNTRVVITRRGGPEVLRVVEEELADPQPGRVRVRIIATGVAYADVLMRYGLYPVKEKVPFAPGYDIVGVTSAGDRVAALTIHGGYARYLDLAQEELVPVPDSLDPAEAVSLVLNYVTADQMLHREANVKSGDRILVHGAEGGVGTALLELGRLDRLEMFGTASSGKQDLVKSLGATPIDYKTEDFVDRAQSIGGVDAVFDAIGGSNWWRSYRCLRAGGRLVVYGISAAISHNRANRAVAVGSFLSLGIMKAIPDGKSASFYAITTYKEKHPDWFREDLSRLLDLLRRQMIHPVIGERLPLREAARAHQLLESASVTGKIVLMCE